MISAFPFPNQSLRLTLATFSLLLNWRALMSSSLIWLPLENRCDSIRKNLIVSHLITDKSLYRCCYSLTCSVLLPFVSFVSPVFCAKWKLFKLFTDATHNHRCTPFSNACLWCALVFVCVCIATI